MGKSSSKQASKDQIKDKQHPKIAIADICNQIQKFYKNQTFHHIKIQDIKVQGVIKEGGMGEILLVILSEKVGSLSNNNQFILRVVPHSFLQQRKVTLESRIAKNVFDAIAGDFILKRCHCIQDEARIYFIDQYASGGDTYSLISKKSLRRAEFKILGEQGIKFILGCIVLAFVELHSKNIEYRDLKPEHVLIMDNGYVKLKQINISKRVSGTLFYFPPEMMAGVTHDKGADFWMLGIYAYQIAVFKPPFSYDVIKQHRENKTKIKELVEVASVERDWKNNKLSEELKDLINKLLVYDPKERLGYENIDDLMSHQFFRDFDWKSLKSSIMKSPLCEIIIKYPTKIHPCN